MLNEALDGEMSSDELQEFNAHLEKCAKCSDCYESEKELLDSIKSKLDCKKCPKELLNLIKSKILPSSN